MAHTLTFQTALSRGGWMIRSGAKCSVQLPLNIYVVQRMIGMKRDEPFRNPLLMVQFFSGVVSGSDETFRLHTCASVSPPARHHSWPRVSTVPVVCWRRMLPADSLSPLSHSSSRPRLASCHHRLPLGLLALDTYLHQFYESSIRKIIMIIKKNY